MTPVLARKADALGLLEEEPLPDPMRISNVIGGADGAQSEVAGCAIRYRSRRASIRMTSR